jgi:hypothetical protein
MTKKGEQPLLQCHYYFIITAKHQKDQKKSSKSGTKKAVPNSWPQDPYHFVVTGKASRA